MQTSVYMLGVRSHPLLSLLAFFKKKNAQLLLSHYSRQAKICSDDVKISSYVKVEIFSIKKTPKLRPGKTKGGKKTLSLRYIDDTVTTQTGLLRFKELFNLVSYLEM